MRVGHKFIVLWFAGIFFLIGASWAGEEQPAPKPLDIDALFLGPKAENIDFLKDSVNFLLNEHAGARRGFQPQDPPYIPPEKLENPEFRSTLRHARRQLAELSARIVKDMPPWYSPRYQGHMACDTLLPATLAFMATMLFNPNNVAYESGMAAAEMELEVGRQLAVLLGFDPAKSWGHITSGGTVANFEGLWYARNLKSAPLALKAVKPRMVEGKSDWELLNMKSDEILDLLDRVRSEGGYEEMLAATVRGRGAERGRLGRILVPASRHYSWDKAADIFGIGIENIVLVPVDSKYRMDMEALDRILAELSEKRVPVLMLVSVAGSTEEGTVDEIHRIADLRRKWEKRGLNFHHHVDAAWGGYIRSAFLGVDGRFLSLAEVRRFAGEKYRWPDPSVYEAFRAIPDADSVTVDSHKMGYVPYPAGAVVFKDRRILGTASVHAPYLEDLRDDPPENIGEFIMEGSKPGASAAAVWTAHRVLPLNVSGYGELAARSLRTAARFFDSMTEMKPLVLRSGKKYRFFPLAKPDTNILDWVVMEEGKNNLLELNRLNRAVYRKCSYYSGPVYGKKFIVSKTVFGRREYGDVPVHFITRLGLSPGDWEATGEIMILRSAVMTPFLDSDEAFEAWWNKFLDAMREVLETASARKE